MDKERKNLLWILLAFLIWTSVSTYHYTCNIKGFCSKKIEMVKKVKIVEEEVDDNQDYNNKTIINFKEKDVQSTPFYTIDGEKRIKEGGEEVIRCFTYINSKLSYNGNNNYPSEVKKLKEFLNNYFNQKNIIDENFDIETESLVKKFQKENKLTEDGVVGADTLKMINAIYCAKNKNID